MEYYFYDLKEVNGEFEYSHKGLLKCADGFDVETWVQDELINIFYGDENPDIQEDYTYFFTGCIAICLNRLTKITEEQWDVLNSFMVSHIME